MKKKSTICYLSDDLKERLISISKEMEISQNAVITLALKQFLKGLDNV